MGKSQAGRRGGVGWWGAAQHEAWQESQRSAFLPNSNARAAHAFFRQDIRAMGGRLPGTKAPPPLKSSGLPAGIPDAEADIAVSHTLQHMRVAIAQSGGRVKLQQIKSKILQEGDAHLTIQQAVRAFQDAGLGLRKEEEHIIVDFLRMILDEEGADTARHGLVHAARITHALEVAMQPLRDYSLTKKPSFAWVERPLKRQDPTKAMERRTVHGAYLQVHGQSTEHRQDGSSTTGKGSTSHGTDSKFGQAVDQVLYSAAHAAVQSRGFKVDELALEMQNLSKEVEYISRQASPQRRRFDPDEEAPLTLEIPGEGFSRSNVSLGGSAGAWDSPRMLDFGSARGQSPVGESPGSWRVGRGRQGSSPQSMVQTALSPQRQGSPQWSSSHQRPSTGTLDEGLSMGWRGMRHLEDEGGQELRREYARAFDISLEGGQEGEATCAMLYSWAIAWLSEARDFGDSSGVGWDEALKAGLADVGLWREEEREAEALVADATYQGLGARVERLVLLIMRLAQWTTTAGETPPMLGEVLQVVMLRLAQHPLVLSGELLRLSPVDHARQTVLKGAVCGGLFDVSVRVKAEAPFRGESPHRQRLKSSLPSHLGSPQHSLHVHSPASALRSVAVRPSSAKTVRSVMNPDGEVAVRVVEAQHQERAAQIRSRVESGTAGPRFAADLYSVGGKRVHVYAPGKWSRAATPPLHQAAQVKGEMDVVDRMYGAQGSSKERRKGPQTARESGLKVPLQMDGGASESPSLWPSNQPKLKGFMSDETLRGDLEVTREVQESLELDRTIAASLDGDAPSLHRNCNGDIVFFSATLGVVQELGEGDGVRRGVQRFFRGHNGLVTCMAMCEGEESKELLLRLVATGQAGSRRDRPLQDSGGGSRGGYVCIWDCVTLQERGRLGLHGEQFAGGLVSLSFSPSGSRLACLTDDARHTLSVFSWKELRLEAVVGTHQYKVSQVVFCPYTLHKGACEVLTTLGERHVHFWVLSGLGASGKAGTAERSVLENQTLHRPDLRLAAWDATTNRLPAPGRLSNVSMAEAASPGFVRKRSMPHDKGYLAGDGASEWVDATATSNKWHGKYFAAKFPPPPDKVVRILDKAVASDPGEHNADWEKGCLLWVIPEHQRPKYEPKGTTVRELREMKQRLVAAAAPPELLGRMASFAIEEELCEADGLPWDPSKVLALVKDDRLSEGDAVRALEDRGWSTNVVRRYLAGGREEERRVLEGSMRGSRGRVSKKGTPDHVTCAAFHLDPNRTEGENGVVSCFCGGTDGKVYHFRVSVTVDEGSKRASVPQAALLQIAECHTSAIRCMRVFGGGEGAVFTGGDDGAVRMWKTTELTMFYRLDTDGFATEWRLGAPVRHMTVRGLLAAKVGMNFEFARVACATSDQEVHEFCIDPEKFRKMECEWSLGKPFSVVWNWRDPIRVNSVGLSHALTRVIAGPRGGVAAVAAHKQERLCAVCSRLGSVFVYTAGEEHQPLSCTIDGGATCGDWSHSGPGSVVFAAGTRKGTVVLLNDGMSVVHTSARCSDYEIKHVRFSPDDKLLVASCGGMKLYLFAVGGKGGEFTAHGVTIGDMILLGTCGGHTSSITGLDWGLSSTHLRSSGGNFELLMWDVSREYGICPTDKVCMLRNEEWASCTSYVGWDVQGVWRKDGHLGRAEAKVRCLVGSQGGKQIQGLQMRKFLFCGEESGAGALMQHPALGKVERKEYLEHAGMCSAAAFDAEDKSLWTAGGVQGEQLLSWRVISAPPTGKQQKQLQEEDTAHSPSFPHKSREGLMGPTSAAMSPGTGKVTKTRRNSLIKLLSKHVLLVRASVRMQGMVGGEKLMSPLPAAAKQGTEAVEAALSPFQAEAPEAPA